MARAKKDKATPIEELVGELERIIDSILEPQELYSCSDGESFGHWHRGFTRWIDDFRVLSPGNDRAPHFEELKSKHPAVDWDTEFDLRHDERMAYLSTGYLLGQARAGVPMDEIKRQCRKMLEDRSDPTIRARREG